MAESQMSLEDVLASIENVLASADVHAPVAEAIVHPITTRLHDILSSGNSVLDLLGGDFAQQVAQIFGPDLAPYLTAPDRRRHLWHCCLAAPDCPIWSEPTVDLAALHRRLLRGKGKHLIAEAYGACPPGLERALGKLGAKARPRAVYAALVAALGRDDAGAKLLRHVRDLPDTMILAVAELPPRLCTKALIAALRTFDDVEKGLPFFAWTIERLEALVGVDLTDAVRRSRQPLALLRRMHQKLPFPPPPWPGNTLLVPLTSRDQLRAAGARLRNCLRDADTLCGAVREVVRGDIYHYEWRGDEPSLLSFRRVEPLGWALEEAKGMDNAPLSQRTRAEISGRLAGVDNVCSRIHGSGLGLWNFHGC